MTVETVETVETEQRINILLVDDRPENLTTLEAVLDDPGYNLVKALSGREALRHILKQEFAVVMLDVQMPGMDGFETARLIRGREKARDVPIIFVTAEIKDMEHVSQAYALKATDYILKPFDPEILRTKVVVLAELHRKKAQVTRQAEELRMVNERLQREIDERARVQEQLEEAQSHERQERERLVMERLSGAPKTSVTAQLYGMGSLAQTVPDVFQELVRQYGEVMDLSLEEKVYKVEHNTSDRLRSMAEQIGFLNAAPRDVIEIHSAALKGMIDGTTAQKAKAYLDEAHLVVLGLMGYLASFYRNYYLGTSKAALREESNGKRKE